MAKTIVNLNQQIVSELSQALDEIGGWGSIEIFVQDNKVTQITKRAIKKTNHPLKYIDNEKKIIQSVVSLIGKYYKQLTVNGGTKVASFLVFRAGFVS